MSTSSTFQVRPLPGLIAPRSSLSASPASHRELTPSRQQMEALSCCELLDERLQRGCAASRAWQTH